MSNKRIRKKRAKADRLRDKSKLIAEFLVQMYPAATRYEYLRMAKPLFHLNMPELLDVLWKAVMARRRVVLSHILHPMVPRGVPIVNWSSVVEYRPTISDVRERQ